MEQQTMAIRDVIHIDEEKCNGCGQCVRACPEGALRLVNGKAKLVSEVYCDGLGACIGECPTGALTVERRQASPFDEEATRARMASHGSPCPGAASRTFSPWPKAEKRERAGSTPSELTHWPIQLHLANPAAPHFQGKDLLIAADCTAFAHGAFHRDLLAGRAVVIACPKLDDLTGYIAKLAELFAGARPPSVTVVRMEVPCCRGLLQLVLQARELAGSEAPIQEVVISIEGCIIGECAPAFPERTPAKKHKAAS